MADNASNVSDDSFCTIAPFLSLFCSKIASVNLQVMNDKLTEADSKLDTISDELRNANKHIAAVSKGQERMDEKLDWIMRQVIPQDLT